MDYEVVTLKDGRKGYFYSSRITGTPIFQPVDQDGLKFGSPELVDPEDHETEDR